MRKISDLWECTSILLVNRNGIEFDKTTEPVKNKKNYPLVFLRRS